jgi:hypothetical protein
MKKRFILLPAFWICSQMHGDDVETLLSNSMGGDPNAQFELADMLEKGTRYQKDMQRAKYWYEKSAIQGNGLAATRLSSIYTRGNGVKRNQKMALAWTAFANSLRNNVDPLDLKTKKPISFVDENKNQNTALKQLQNIYPVKVSMKYFTIGSTREHVIAVQGKPRWLDNKFDPREFNYGLYDFSSRANVFFDRHGHVVSWKNNDQKLLAKFVADLNKYPGIETFTYGSPIELVVIIKGQPEEVYRDRLIFSDGVIVYFDEDNLVKKK